MLWAFAENPSETISVTCHVLQHCVYDLILGSTFLTSTGTLSRHRRRLVECLFSVANLFHFSFLDGSSQFLEGTLADRYPVLAVPDSGAEANVIDYRYVSVGIERCLGPIGFSFLLLAHE